MNDPQNPNNPEQPQNQSPESLASKDEPDQATTATGSQPPGESTTRPPTAAGDQAAPPTESEGNPAGPEASSPDPKSPIASDHRNKGKVARLTKKLRDQVNQMIDDGVPYGEIIQQLGDAGKDLNEKNISTWKSGGHQPWLKEQQRLGAMRARQEFAFDLVNQNGGATTHQAAFQIAALQLCDLLDDFDPALLKNTLHDDPETYAVLLNAYTRLLNAMPRISQADADCERVRTELEAAKAKMEKGKPGDKPPGLSPEARRLIEKELNLM